MHTNTQAVVIIGAGQTGLSCARFCVQQGCHVAVMDTRTQPPARDILRRELPEVLLQTGKLDQARLMQADTIVLSPGVDPRLPELVAAREAGIEMVGDIELFARHANAPVVAITGSNGKSTVTTLLAEMAVEAGRQIQVGGNLGTPALDLLCEPAPDFYILELSSFQLETVHSLNAFAATILNISPDHLDRYDSLQAYQQAKSAVFAGDGVKVLNLDDIQVMRYAQSDGNQIGFSLQPRQDADFSLIRQDRQYWLAAGEQPLIRTDALKMRGRHNMANALAALALGSAMGLEMTAMLTALTRFEGLPHRCRLVAEKDGIRWFNDSKATNVGACIAAIEGLAEHGGIILIAGGTGKEQDFSALSRVLAAHVRHVVLMGQDAEQIARITPAQTGVHHVSTIKEAVAQAAVLAKTGDQVLLSPACASFDMFTSYADRGAQFEQAVQSWIR